MKFTGTNSDKNKDDNDSPPPKKNKKVVKQLMTNMLVHNFSEKTTYQISTISLLLMNPIRKK